MDDVVFKLVLGSNTEDSREVLRSLLSACTRRKVSKVEVHNSELMPMHLGGKTVRLDVHVTFNDGESADLEMQSSASSDNLRARAEFYASMLLAGQQIKGKPYRGLKRVYQIFFLNDILFPGSDRLPRRYQYREEKEHDRLSDVTEIIFYELPKLAHRLEDFLSGKIDVESLTGEELWCLYIKYRHDEKAVELLKMLYRKEEGIMRAERSAAKIDRDYKKYARKMAAIKNSMDRAQLILDAQEEGHERGIKKGEQNIVELLKSGKSPEEIIREFGATKRDCKSGCYNDRHQVVREIGKNHRGSLFHPRFLFLVPSRRYMQTPFAIFCRSRETPFQRNGKAEGTEGRYAARPWFPARSKP